MSLLKATTSISQLRVFKDAKTFANQTKGSSAKIVNISQRVVDSSNIYPGCWLVCDVLWRDVSLTLVGVDVVGGAAAWL